MHSYDRTMLAKLGFDDPDKKDRRHDLACQYLASPEVSGKFAESFLVPLAASKSSKTDNVLCRGHSSCHFERFGDPIFEKPVSKGEGKYQTVIGFLDLVLPFSFMVKFEGESRSYDYCEWKLDSYECRDRRMVAFEVKIAPIGVGDIVRQINLYSEFYRGSIWVAATHFPLSASDIATLRASSIRHVRLGPGFDAWCEAAKSAADDSGYSIDL